MNLFVVDDNQNIRSALRLFISQQSLWTICGDADNIVSGLALLNQLNKNSMSCPDVILLDIEINGLQKPVNATKYRELISLFNSFCPSAVVLGWSAQDDKKKAVLASGIAGFISKNDPPETILTKLNQAIKK